jgi:hypothetical protein
MVAEAPIFPRAGKCADDHARLFSCSFEGPRGHPICHPALVSLAAAKHHGPLSKVFWDDEKA